MRIQQSELDQVSIFQILLRIKHAGGRAETISLLIEN